MEVERSALRIRKFAGVKPFEALDPFKLAEQLHMKVVDIANFPDLTVATAEMLLIHKAHEWSGASSGVLTDGEIIILLNTTQSIRRRRATLMEEICHVLLGHQRDRLPISQAKRDYNNRQETEAYAVGAAALVPYIALRNSLAQGRSIKDIARHFQVSPSLVQYRERTTTLP